MQLNARQDLRRVAALNLYHQPASPRRSCALRNPFFRYSWRLAGRLAKAKPPKDGLYRYRARKGNCDSCDLNMRCCPNEVSRKVLRSIHKEARDYTRALMETKAYSQSRNRRKKIETLIGEVKHNLALTRLRLRGLLGAEDEFLLTATVQNLKRLA